MPIWFFGVTLNSEFMRCSKNQTMKPVKMKATPTAQPPRALLFSFALSLTCHRHNHQDVMVKAEQLLESSAFCVQPHDLVQMKDLDVKKIKTNVAGEDMNLYSQDNEHTLSQKNAISHPK
ncbi:hypothetical protein JHK85_004749 [Glycine max]|nr:hypothetical protein JHK85_004749 [Glycine max]